MSANRLFKLIFVAIAFVSVVGINFRFARPARALLPFQAPGATIPYSGMLSDEAGQPVVDGTYNFTFLIYEYENGGQPQWAETQENVAVRGGGFTVLLGSVSPIPRDVLYDGSRWLEVEVRGPAETDFTLLTPRQELSAIASLKPVSSASKSGSACAHDHLGESWLGASSLGLSLEDTASNSVAIQGVANNGSNATGILGSSVGGKGVYGYSSSGISLYAGGSGTISSSANSVLYLSPHDMEVRFPSEITNIDLYRLYNGGVQIIDRKGNRTIYLTLPVSTFGKLFGADLYVKSIRVCYKALLAPIVATSVIKNNGGEGDAFYIYDTTPRGSNTYECYTVTALTPRVPINNSTWVQFNVQTGALNELDIYTVELTLTEEQQD